MKALQEPTLTAWVPDDDRKRPWDDAAELAAAWIRTQAKALKVKPRLVIAAASVWSTAPSCLRDLADQSQALTPRRGAGGGATPIVAYVPDHRCLDLAVHASRGSALAVVETVHSPVLGWAMETGAINLLTEQPTEDTRSDRARDMLDRLSFYGNNAWSDRFGKQQAMQILL